MDRSDCGVKVSVSLEVLLAGVVSPLGWVTLAVFTTPAVAEAFGWMTAVTVNVTVPPGSSVTVSLMLPVPLLVVTLEPAEATADQLSLLAMPVSVLSVTVWLTAVLGPLLLTTTVYTTVLSCPGMIVPPVVLLVPAL